MPSRHPQELNVGGLEPGADRLAGLIRADPRVKLMPYKGWVPKEASPEALRAFLDDARRNGQMVICEDPRSAVAALGRTPPGFRPLPAGLCADWIARSP